MKLLNKNLAGKKLVSAHAMLEFNEEGIAIKPELSEELIKAFAEIPGFEIVEEKKDVKKDVKPEEEEKEKKPTKRETRKKEADKE